MLQEIGYDGWLTIESFAEPEPELASAASIWRDLAPSGDELAHQGLAFIKLVQGIGDPLTLCTGAGPLKSICGLSEYFGGRAVLPWRSSCLESLWGRKFEQTEYKTL